MSGYRRHYSMGEVSYTQAQLDQMSHDPGLGFGMYNAIYMATPSRPGNYYMDKIYKLLTGPDSPVYLDAATAVALKTKLLAYQTRLRALEAGQPLPPIPATVIQLPTVTKGAMQTVQQEAGAAAQEVKQAATSAGIAAQDWIAGTSNLYGMNLPNKYILYALACVGVVMLITRRQQ